MKGNIRGKHFNHNFTHSFGFHCLTNFVQKKGQFVADSFSLVWVFIQSFNLHLEELIYKYWLPMVENYCPEVKLNLCLLFTEDRRAEVNSRPMLSFTEGTIIFYHSPNKRAVNICFIHPIHRFFSPYRTESRLSSSKFGSGDGFFESQANSKN